MRWLLLTGLVLLPLSACVKIGTADDSSAGNATGASAGGSDAGVTTVSGTNCDVDPTSGISLCLGITSCPTVSVDPDQFPGCGYRISGAVIDLECLCNDSLCPVGSAASCADAKALLADQSAQGVCAEIAEGRCSVMSQSTANATPGTNTKCDKDCRTSCSGDPSCISFCGC